MPEPRSPALRQHIEVGAAHDDRPDGDEREALADRGEQQDEEVEVEELGAEAAAREERGGDPAGVDHDHRGGEVGRVEDPTREPSRQHVREQRGADERDHARRRHRELPLDEDQVRGRGDEGIAEEEKRFAGRHVLRHGLHRVV